MDRILESASAGSRETTPVPASGVASPSPQSLTSAHSGNVAQYSMSPSEQPGVSRSPDGAKSSSRVMEEVMNWNSKEVSVKSRA